MGEGMVSGTEPTGAFNVRSEKTLVKRVEDGIRAAVANELDGRTTELVSIGLSAKAGGDYPILNLGIPGQDPGTSTTIQVPVGRAVPEEGIYFARINEGEYLQYSSPEEIGYAASKASKGD